MSRVHTLTVQEASAALATMAAGRSDVPDISEIRAIVAQRTSKLPPATARLISEIEGATRREAFSSDPIARALAEFVATAVAIVRHEIERTESGT